MLCCQTYYRLSSVDRHRGDTAALILLDLSAAFNMVDHAILLQRLQTTFGINDSAHRWFQSYLSGRHQYVYAAGLRDQPSFTSSAVCLEGSVLGPVLFVLYTVELISLIERHMVCRRIFTPMIRK